MAELAQLNRARRSRALNDRGLDRRAGGDERARGHGDVGDDDVELPMSGETLTSSAGVTPASVTPAYYTSVRTRRGKAPVRSDRCLLPSKTKPVRCPAS